MSKTAALFEIDGDFDFEAVLASARKIMRDEGEGRVYVEGGRPEGNYTTPGAQIIMKFKSEYGDWDVNVLISHKGKIQIFYETLGDFCRCFFILKWLLGYKRFRDLRIIDANSFEMYLAGLEYLSIYIDRDRSAACANIGLPPSREMLRTNMRVALIDFLHVLFQEVKRVISRDVGDRVYESTVSWAITMWKYFSWLLIELWEDKETARGVLDSLSEHLNVLVEKWKRDALLLENKPLSEDERYLVEDWKRINEYYRGYRE